MKKSKIAVASLLAASIMSVMGSCSKSGEQQDAAAIVPGDFTTVNTRYVNMKRVGENYTLAQEVFAEQQRLLLDFQNQAQQRQTELNRMGQNIEQKAKNNIYLSQQSFQADQDALYRRQAEAQQWSDQRQQQIAVYMGEQNQRLNDSIRNAIRYISEINHFDAVLDDTVAYYVNPALDITEVVIAELNRRYKAVVPVDTALVKK